MTREIRFRAWDRKNKKICGVTLMGNGYVWLDDKWIETRALHISAHEIGVTCDIMQFTGLKDKNGKSIYEGDYVKIGKDLTQCAYDKFGIPCLLGLKYPEAHDFMAIEQMGLNKLMEVVGNVYENPELLK